MTIKAATCRKCGEQFPFDDKDIVLFGQKIKFAPTICDECDKAMQEQERRAAIAERARLVLPYHDWNPAIGNKALLDKLIASGNDSLYVCGLTGAGKSRGVAELCRRLMIAGYSVIWVACGRESDALAQAAGESMRSLESRKAKMLEPQVLVLDDFGKGKSGERVASEWFDIIDRVAIKASERRIRLIITTNYPISKIAQHFSEEYGPPISRRIVDMCSLIDVGELQR